MNIYKKILCRVLQNLNHGQLILIEGNQTHTFGQPSAPPITLQIKNSKAYKMILLHGSLGAGKAYIQGYWQSQKLPELIELILRNQTVFEKLDGFLSKLSYYKDTTKYLLQKNIPSRSKKHIEAHYDLNNEFFNLFLDDYMMYSCAIYEHPNQSLEEASINKLKTICNKLELCEDDHLLEIGTGWGGLAIYAAKFYGCKVTTTTISTQQYYYTKELVSHLNLQDQITVLNKDYRELSGEYDKCVSVEMIEAVGFQYFSDYFQTINRCLKPNGLFLLQAITIDHRYYDAAKYEVDFIKKYIFPGGCLPSMEQIQHHIQQDTQFEAVEIEDIGQHYVKTLADWNDAFQSNLEQIKALSFPDDFINKWTFYFAYCQAGFMNQHISDIHGLWKKK